MLIQGEILPTFNVINTLNQEIICNLCTNYVVDGSLISQYTVENINDFGIQVSSCLKSDCPMPTWLFYTLLLMGLMLIIIGTAGITVYITCIITAYAPSLLKKKRIKSALNRTLKRKLH
jgi:hypothetical protein